MVLRSSVDSTPFRTNTKSREALFSSCTHCNASYKRVTWISGRCQGEFTGYFQNVFWVSNIYGCTYLQVIDVEILFNDGFGLLVQLFLTQGGFGLNRWWWSRSRHWLHWEIQAGKESINLKCINSKTGTAGAAQDSSFSLLTPTCLLASITLPTASIAVLCHAGHAAHRIWWSTAVASSAVLIFTAEAAFGDGLTGSVKASVPVIPPTIKSVKAIPITTVSVTTISIATVPTGAVPAK